MSPTPPSRSAMSARSPSPAMTVRALRVTYVGELGWELHVPIAATGEVFDALMAAGKPHGIRPVGYRALESLRLEKGYRAWGSDITPNDTPFEAGLGWAVKLGRTPTSSAASALETAQRRRADQAARRLHGRRPATWCCSAARRSCATASRSATSPAAATATRSARTSATAMCATPTASATISSPAGDYELVVAMRAGQGEAPHAAALRSGGRRVKG